MMNVTFACPRCEQPGRVELQPDAAVLVCPGCHQELAVPEGAMSEGKLSRCVVCPSTELFVRKDFPQHLGVAIVVVGIVASCVSWAYYMTYLTFAILFGTALLDVVLYAFVGEALMCYRCGAQYRGLSGIDEHEAFNLEIHERYRQQAARLQETVGAGSTQASVSPSNSSTETAQPPDEHAG